MEQSLQQNHYLIKEHLIDNIKVTFKDGKIIEAHASKGEEVLQKV